MNETEKKRIERIRRSLNFYKKTLKKKEGNFV